MRAIPQFYVAYTWNIKIIYVSIGLNKFAVKNI